MNSEKHTHAHTETTIGGQRADSELRCGRQRLFSRLWRQKRETWLATRRAHKRAPCPSLSPGSPRSSSSGKHTGSGDWGTHPLERTSVRTFSWRNSAQRRRTDVHARLPRISHPDNSALLFFSFFPSLLSSTLVWLCYSFLSFFILFFVLTNHLALAIIKLKIILIIVPSLFLLRSLSQALFLLFFHSSVSLTSSVSLMPSLKFSPSLPLHLCACFGYEMRWNSELKLAVNGVVLSQKHCVVY